MTKSLAETQVARSVAEKLSAAGYQVYAQPSPDLLPAFFRDSYKPDLIALREDANLAVEITSRSSLKDERLEQITQIFSSNPNWKFKLYWIEDFPKQESLPRLSAGEISQKLGEADHLIGIQHTGAAFLLLWASFEAIARSVMPGRFEMPQSPGRVVQILATEGWVTPSEADRLNRYIRQRNALIHGDLSIQISQSDAKDMLSIVEALLPKQAA